MKKIIVKEIRLLNFKGIRDLSIKFDANLTEISGKNGVGKSTIFDAFCWLLFGKNAADKKDFSLKTTDEAGIAIPRLPHEVEAVISVNSTDITLKRCFSEKWTKKRGEAVEQFSGHTEERFFNDVPCSASEYDAKVKDICTEEVFKFITNPSYFPTRKEDVQRKLLFDMVGGVSDADIARDNEDFTALLDALTGKTMEEYKKEIASKKRRVKAEVEAIPERIDERKRDITQTAEDTTSDERELSEKKAALANVEAQIADSSKSYQAASDARLQVIREIQTLKEQKMKRESAIVFDVQTEYRNAMRAKRDIEEEIDREQKAVTRNIDTLAKLQEALGNYKTERESLLTEWKRIKAAIEAADAPMNEQMFICPTCGRRYELDEIEEKRKLITERYLDNLLSEKTQNQEKGIALKAKIQQTDANIVSLTSDIAARKKKIEELKADKRLTVSITEPDGRSEIESDEQLKQLSDAIAELQQKADAPVEARDQSELLEAKRVLSDAIAELQQNISKQQRIAEDNEKNNKRIAELEHQLRQQSEELAKLEKIEFTIQSFSKARTRAIEDKINALFSFVRFKLFDTQINGAEIECCIPMINGVPYADANTAGRINAGLDIINAISKAQEIAAPIFIDGAESINKLLQTQSQVVTLTVTLEDTLNVRVGGASATEQSLFN
jgi:hypothetical protein